MKYTRKTLIALLCIFLGQCVLVYADNTEINDGYIDDLVTEYPESVLRFHKKMAENGSLSAQKLLGNLYLSGNEIQIDLNESKRWFVMAAGTGDFDSVNQLMLIDVMLNGYLENVHSEWYKKLQTIKPLTTNTSKILQSVKILKGNET